MKIGEYNTLTVSHIVDFGAYLKADEQEILLPGKWLPEGTQPGDELEVFLYTDSEDRPIATTMKPKASVGEFAIMEVKTVEPFGAFLDWGLEKDLLLPKSEQIRPHRVGEKVVVRLSLDYKTNRVIGTTKIAAFLKPIPEHMVPGQAVEAWVYHSTPLGYQVLVDRQYAGLLYRSEVFEDLRSGDQKTAYVRRIREDGKMDVNLKAFGKEGMLSDRDKVLQELQLSGGRLPLGDKSDADDIYNRLKMSKKSFKRAIGILYKERMINISQQEIWLQEEGV